MAVRNTAARRIPGDPLGGVLRQTARLARRSTRRTTQADVSQELMTDVACQPGPVAHAVASLVTDAAGVAVWYYDVIPGPIIIVATATGDTPAVVTVRHASQDVATLYAATLHGVAAAGTVINVVAYSVA